MKRNMKLYLQDIWESILAIEEYAQNLSEDEFYSNHLLQDAIMLKLYQTQVLTGFRYLHGRKGDRPVHIGPLNAPVTMEEVEKVVIECRANNFNKTDVLGWEWL